MRVRELDGRKGETRSVLRREYLLHTPDAFVRTPMPEITGGVAVVHASPRLGAEFLMYTAELDPGGALGFVAEQRFCWVLEGTVRVAELADVSAGGYAYLPPHTAGTVRALTAAALLVIEKGYEALAGVDAPATFAGREEEVTPVALGGDAGLLVRALLPADLGFDFAVNTMTYAAGTALAQVEVHVMEHGLLMLEGAGTYRLGDERYAVRAGDAIWMGPYCPQWFVSEGDGPAKYLIYKDWNRRPRL